MKNNAVNTFKKNRIKIFFGLIVIILFSLIAFFGHLYQHINEQKVMDYQTTEDRVTQEQEISKIESISRFHGTHYFHVVEAETSEQEEVIIYVNQSEPSADLIIFSKKDLITKEELINRWKNDTNFEKLYQVQYAIRDEIPLVEIIYLDESERLSYDYYRLDNGEYDNGISFANK